MNDFSQLGFEDSHYEHTLIVREKAEIRKVAKYVGIAYLVCILIPDILSYFIVDLAESYRSMAFITKIFTHPILSMVYQIVISAVAFVLPFFAVSVGLNLKTSELISVRGKRNRLTLPMVLMGLGFCAFANIAANSISSLLGSFGIGIYSPTYSSSKTVPEFLVTFVAVAIIPAIVEEFAFRGMVLGVLRRFGDGFAILVSALVFGLIHQNAAQIPFAFIVGIVLAFATIKTGSILTSVLIHFLNNALSLLISTFTEILKNDMATTVIYSLYFALCFLFFFMGVALMSSKGKDVWKPYRTTHKLTSKQRVICFFSHPIMILNIALSLFTTVSLLVYMK